MIEAGILNGVSVNSQIEVNCETKAPKTIDDVLKSYDSSLHSALFENDDDEGDFDMECARETLVDEGLSVVKTVGDCDRISSELNIIKNESLLKRVWAKRDSLEFAALIKEFDTRHKKILEESTSSDEDSEALETDKCDQLRYLYFSEAVKLANSQKECQEILGRTSESHTYIRQLVNEKMATLPIESRKS
jgi:hypothetical protein